MNNGSINLNNLSNIFQTELENILTDIFNDDMRHNIQTTINNISPQTNNRQTTQTTSDSQQNTNTTNIGVNSQNTRTTQTSNQGSQTNTRNNVNPTQNNTRYRSNSASYTSDFNRTNPRNISIDDYYNTLSSLLSSINSSNYEYNLNYRLYQQNMQFALQELTYIRPYVFSMNRNNYRETPIYRHTQPNQNIFNSIRRHINIPNDITARNNRELLYFFLNPYVGQFNNTQTNRTGRLLTNDEINRTTQRLEYNFNMSETRCPISLEDFSENEEIIQINGCGHIFKTTNLLSWLTREYTCPVCRFNLLNSLNTNPSTNTAPETDNETDRESESDFISDGTTYIATVEVEIEPNIQNE